MNNLSNIYKLEGNVPLAAEYAEKAILLAPEHPGPYTTLGCVYSDFDVNKANTSFKKAFELDWMFFPVIQNYLFNLSKMDQHRWVLEILEDLSSRTESSYSSEIQYQLGYVYANCFSDKASPEWYEKVIYYFENAISLHHKDHKLLKNSLYISHLNLGQCYFFKELYKKSIESLRLCLDINPGIYTERIYYHLAHSYRMLECFSEAEIFYRKLFLLETPEKDRCFVENVVPFCYCLYHSSKYKELINTLEPMLLDLSNDNLTHAMPILAAAYESVDSDKSITFYKRYIKLNPLDSDGYQNLASLYKKLKRYDEALEIIEAILDSEHGNKYIYALASDLYGIKNQKELSDKYRYKFLSFAHAIN